jgi:hypothetical protein
MIAANPSRSRFTFNEPMIDPLMVKKLEAKAQQVAVSNAAICP